MSKAVHISASATIDMTTLPGPAIRWSAPYTPEGQPPYRSLWIGELTIMVPEAQVVAFIQVLQSANELLFNELFPPDENGDR